MVWGSAGCVPEARPQSASTANSEPRGGEGPCSGLVRPQCQSIKNAEDAVNVFIAVMDGRCVDTHSIQLTA